ncbi:MAG: TPM domain-containing protein [Hyphomicrobium sp.]
MNHAVGARRLALFGLAVLVACFIFGLAVAAPTYPELTGRIVDNANLLNSADRAAIEAELSALEQTSTDQLAIATVPSLEGYPIEDYAIGLARKWQLGQKDKDNGVLLLIAPNERKVRIEVGRRLEPMMTDTMSKLIIENAILPQFRRGDFSGGVRDGVRDIKAVLLGDAEEVKQRAKVGRTPGDDPTALIHLLIFIAIVLLIVYISRQQAREMQQTAGPDGRRRRRRDNGGIVIIPGGSSDWSGGGGGGGWSGGGGGFGGGGASGDW